MRRFVGLVLASTMLLACTSEDVSDATDIAEEQQEAAPPAMQITYRPFGEETVEGIEVELGIEAPQLEPGEALLRMPVVLVGTPTAAYQSEDIEAQDDKGVLELKDYDEEPDASGQYRQYQVIRATEGDVVVRYRTPPRDVDVNTRNGPLFDIRPQNGGFMGAGVYFLALPHDESGEQSVYQIDLDWDFSLAPEGTRGVWSLGEGSQQFTRPLQNLRFAFYGVGEVKSADSDPAAPFNMYWISEPPFNMELLATNIVKLFRTMAEFHGKPDEEYRVFIRSNPHKGGGGTGFVDSFAFSYGIDNDSPEDGPLMLLSHEIAHNWTGFRSSEPHPLTAWYSEGTAEFYKVTMAYRAGLLDGPAMLEELNKMAVGYYSNPYIANTNEEAGALFWQDGLAQRVPYGRGFMYLSNVDAQIREATDGEQSLDDLILDINRRLDDGERIGNERWQELLAEYIGDQAYSDHEAMVDGNRIVPHPQSWGPCFEPVESDVLPFELGFDRMNLGTVTSLVADSNAAQAGLQEGDSIVQFTPLRCLRNDETAYMEITVLRGSGAAENGDAEPEELTVRYLPRGEPISAWQWQTTDYEGACVQ